MLDLPFDMPPMPEVKRRVLDRERIGAYRLISRYVLENAQYELIEQEATGLMIQLVSEVLTEKIAQEDHEVTYNPPATWWQFFKATYREQWWMRRFVKRYPVKRATVRKIVHFEAKRNYPNADIPPTPLNRPIVVETVSETAWSTP